MMSDRCDARLTPSADRYAKEGRDTEPSERHRGNDRSPDLAAILQSSDFNVFAPQAGFTL